ncbi:MAG: (Fe-S)-binding protein [Nitrospirota bacterium]
MMEDISKCVRCGSCKAFCPTYDDSALESMGARGRLMLLRGLATGLIKPSNLLNDRIFSCVLCGACTRACPLGVDIIEAIYHGRALLNKKDKKRKMLRSLVRFSARWPELSFKILRMSRHILLPALARRGIIPFSPELSERPFRSADQVYKAPQKKGRVALFTGCSTNFLFPHLGESLINVLRKFGYEVVLPKGEVCCGTPLRTLGLEEEAIELSRKNVRVFGKLNVEAILSLCPTCTLTLRSDYPKIIGEGLEKAMDISVFFNEKLGVSHPRNKTSVFHDPCHLYYGLGIKKEPREIIRKAGIELLEPEDPGCCGFGGLFCMSYKDISNNLLGERTKKYIKSKADAVITSCPGCMLQLSRAITDRPVLHLVEVIEDTYCYSQSDKIDRNKEKD